MGDFFRPSEILLIFMFGLFITSVLYLNNLKETHKEFIHNKLGEKIWIEEAGENKLFGSFKYNVYLNKNGKLGTKEVFVFEGKEFIGKK